LIYELDPDMPIFWRCSAYQRRNVLIKAFKS